MQNWLCDCVVDSMQKNDIQGVNWNVYEIWSCTWFSKKCLVLCVGISEHFNKQVHSDVIYSRTSVVDKNLQGLHRVIPERQSRWEWSATKDHSRSCVWSLGSCSNAEWERISASFICQQCCHYKGLYLFVYHKLDISVFLYCWWVFRCSTVLYF